MSELLAGLFLGLAGSVHCAAMCGPLTLALHGRRGVPLFVAHHAGRLSMYAAAGVAAGTGGHVVVVLGAGRGLAWLAGVVLLLSAASHLGIGPALSGLPLARIVGHVARASRSACREHPTAGAFAGGVLNAWLPCGMVYAALTAAAALGQPSAGLAFMALFGLGTLPALAAVWLLSGVVTPAVRRGLTCATPVALVVVGLMLIARGFTGPLPSPDRIGSAHAHGAAAAGS
jgi:sulfite exporter TauE/SafE